MELKTGHYYHAFNKSIAGFVIFNSDGEFQRMIQAIHYYRSVLQDYSLSNFLRSDQVSKMGINNCLSSLSKDQPRLVEIVALCLMPTHIHFLLKQSRDDGISTFMGNLLNSYARYFNKKHERKGPLWVGRFKAVLIETDEQLRHVSRYIHLNPTTAGLVRKPELWKYSSYKESINAEKNEFTLTTGTEVFDNTPEEYQKFVENQISYQKELAAIKHLILE